MAERIRKLKTGDMAPNFTLKDHNGQEFKLAELKGKRVLLSFHPAAWTGVCAKQMQALEKHYDTFISLNTIPVGISVDSVPAKKAWAEHLGVEKVPLLSDFWPHGKVAKLYDIFIEEKGFSERANIIVDENGKIVFFKVYEISQLPDIDEVIKTLKNL